jgi:undecaprenyl-diphosphatase
MTRPRPSWLPRRWLQRVRAWLPQESRILLAALGIVLGVWLFWAIASAMSSGRTQGIDERVLLALRRVDDRGIPIGPRWLQTAALELTALGSGVVLVTIVLLVLGYLAIERRFAMLGYVALASFGGMILNTALKTAFARPRPTIVPPLTVVGSTSFPSGHSMIAAAVYLTLGALLARTTTRWRLRLYYLGAALAMTGVIGLTRVYLGVHYPSDVLAGWAAGAAWALACELGAAYLQRRGVVAPPAR